MTVYSILKSFETSPNKRVSGSGFQPSPKSPSAPSDTRKPLCDMPLKYREGEKHVWERNYHNKAKC